VAYSRHSNRHFIVGVLILLLGFVLLLDQLGFVEANKIFMFWPLILIYFGLNRFFGYRDSVARFWGGFLILLGVSFQARGTRTLATFTSATNLARFPDLRRYPADLAKI